MRSAAFLALLITIPWLLCTPSRNATKSFRSSANGLDKLHVRIVLVLLAKLRFYTCDNKWTTIFTSRIYRGAAASMGPESVHSFYYARSLLFFESLTRLQVQIQFVIFVMICLCSKLFFQVANIKGIQYSGIL